MTTYTTAQLGQALDITYDAAISLAERLARLQGWQDRVRSGGRYAWGEGQVLAALILRECGAISVDLRAWLYEHLPVALERSPYRWFLVFRTAEGRWTMRAAHDDASLLQLLKETRANIILDIDKARSLMADRLGDS